MGQQIQTAGSQQLWRLAFLYSYLLLPSNQLTHSNWLIPIFLYKIIYNNRYFYSKNIWKLCLHLTKLTSLEVPIYSKNVWKLNNR